MSWVNSNVRNAKECLKSTPIQNGLATDGNSIFRVSRLGKVTFMKEMLLYDGCWSDPARQQRERRESIMVPVKGDPEALERALNAIKAVAGVEARTEHPRSACTDIWALTAYALHCATKETEQ